MTKSTTQILGTAAQVAQLFGDEVSIGSMYDAAGARFYNNMTRFENAEIKELLAAAKGIDGAVLELACGSGRITVPFLKEGYDVVGLDYSPAMLELLDARLREDDVREHASRLRAVHGDMTDFSLGQKFGVIMLGASAIWNVGSEGRAGLFRSVREHLADGGKFLFTLIEFRNLSRDTDPFEMQVVFASLDSDPQAFVTFLDYVDPAAELRSTNVVAQAVVDGKVVGVDIYTALTHLVSPDELEAEIVAAGLKVAGRTEVTSGYQILKASAFPVAVQLVEVTL